MGIDITPSERIDVVRRIEDLAVGAGVAAVVQAAVQLGLPDALGAEPRTAGELAKDVGADPGTLGRLLRALAYRDVVAEVSPGKYAETVLSRNLRTDAPFGLRDLVLWLGAPWTWQAWPRLVDAIRTGGPVVPDIFGKDFYSYLAQDAPESGRLFDRAMTALTRVTSGRIAESFDLSGVGTVADVAGGQGRLLRTLLERFPAVQGVLFDLGPVVEGADPALRDGGPLAERCRIVAGDCLKDVPVTADLYVLKNILDWPDDNSVVTLRNVVANAPRHARVIVVDSLMEASPEELRVTSLIDLFLLLNVGGQRHTRQQFEDLFAATGLRLTRAVPIPDTFPTLHLIEAVIDE
jgi:C-methyltransferase